MVQRVSRGAVYVASEKIAQIASGHLVLAGFLETDTPADLQYMADKIINLRLFDDESGKLNLSLLDTAGELLVVSQFTLYGDARKGRRPSYSSAATVATAQRLYEEFLLLLTQHGVKVSGGRFQAHMEVELVNDGPVTILLDSRRQF